MQDIFEVELDEEVEELDGDSVASCDSPSNVLGDAAKERSQTILSSPKVIVGLVAASSSFQVSYYHPEGTYLLQH
jgi:hypothetical protein